MVIRRDQANEKRWYLVDIINRVIAFTVEGDELTLTFGLGIMGVISEMRLFLSVHGNYIDTLMLKPKLIS